MNYFYFFTGFVSGAVLAAIAMLHFRDRIPMRTIQKPTEAKEARSNDNDDEDQRKKLQQQFNNMMAYTGKRQK